MDLNRSAVTLLARLGFCGCFNGLPEQAVTIFDALSAARPDDPALTAAHALALLNAGRTERALALFEQALAARPDDATTRAFYVLALKLDGRAGAAAAVLRPLNDAAMTPAAAALARQVGALGAAGA